MNSTRLKKQADDLVSRLENLISSIEYSSERKESSVSKITKMIKKLRRISHKIESIISSLEENDREEANKFVAQINDHSSRFERRLDAIMDQNSDCTIILNDIGDENTETPLISQREVPDSSEKQNHKEEEGDLWNKFKEFALSSTRIVLIGTLYISIAFILFELWR